jgi:TonB-linked SusC/RagA family outer membrane protein
MMFFIFKSNIKQMRKAILTMLFVVATCVSLLAQKVAVIGKITDSSGGPVAGATVVEKGTKNAVSANNDGIFTINASSANAVFIVSATGFISQEVSGSKVATVVLQPDTKTLSEVVVVAYGSQKKTNITGAISVVKGTEVEDKPFSSVDKALQGSVAGLNISSGNGIPGSSTDVRIRGIGSIEASSSPLWVIDGIIATTGDMTSLNTSANALSGLNPDDIESISVLKDAAASAIYGSRAANGVIIVTTKSGKSGKTKVNFTTELGRNTIAYSNKNNRPMTTDEYLKVFRQSIINAGYADNDAEADALFIDPVEGFGFAPDWYKTNTDWLKAVTRTGNQQQYNLSLSGGNEKTQYYASAGYFNQDGTTIATYFKRYNGSLSVSSKVTDKLTFKAGINGSSSLQLSPPGSAAYSSPVSGASFIQPWYNPYNADGTPRFLDDEGQFPNGTQFNPVAMAQMNKQTAKQVQLRGYVSGEYQILPNLKFMSKYSGEYLTADEYVFWNPFYGDGASYQGLGQANIRNIYDWTWTNQFNYKLDLNNARDFYLDLIAGTEAYALSDNNLYSAGSNFPSTLALTYLASAATPIDASNSLSERSVNSYFSSGTLNYKDRYVLTGSFRRDGSSVFAKDKKWGNFYSIGGSWNVSEEEFFRNVDAISLLKLRASYGVTGNTSGFGNYLSLSTYSFGSAYTGSAGSYPSNVGNPNLSWEKNKLFNVGVDLGLWRNRLTATVEYYDRTTSDLLINVPLSLTSGFSGGQLMNVGSMYNKGVEVTLSGKPIATKQFTWHSSFNLAHNVNKVTKLYNGSPISKNTRFNITEGHNIYEFYTRLWAGVDPANGDPLWYTDETMSKTTNNANNAGLALTGKVATPKFYGSFTNTFTYRNISLEGQLYYNFGNYIYNTWENYLSSDGLYYGAMNQMSSQLNAWQKEGDITNTPKIIYGGNKLSNRPSTRYLYKGDYIRLRNIQLSYNFPKAVLAKAKISSLNLYVRGTNLLTFGTDKNLPVDPEAGATNINDFQVFNPKTVSVGLKLGF